jgi:virulence-associated protein VapD
MKDFVEKFYNMKRNASLEIKALKANKEVSETEKKEQLVGLNIKKNLAKLLFNSTYGSTLVDSLRFTEVEQVSMNNVERIQKLTSSFRFKDALQVNEFF